VNSRNGDVTILSVPLQKYYCLVSIRNLDAASRLFVFKVGIQLRNKVGQDLRVDFVELFFESLTFDDGATLKSRRSLGKQNPTNPTLSPGGVLRMEWVTQEPARRPIKPAVISYRVVLKFAENPTALEYHLNISSPQFKF